MGAALCALSWEDLFSRLNNKLMNGLNTPLWAAVLNASVRGRPGRRWLPATESWAASGAESQAPPDLLTGGSHPLATAASGAYLCEHLAASGATTHRRGHAQSALNDAV